MCHRLLIKNLAMGIHVKINHWLEEFLKQRNFRLKLCHHYLSEGTVKSGGSNGSKLGPLMFIIDEAGKLTCNRLFFSDDVKLISPRRHQSIQQAFTWSRRCDLLLSKSHRLSLGGPPELRLVLCEVSEGKVLQKYWQINGHNCEVSIHPLR